MIVLTRNQKEYSQIDASALSPEVFSGRSIDEIRELKLHHGRTTVAVGDVFHVSRRNHAIETEDPTGLETLLLEGDCSFISHLGASLRSGTLVVRGNVGDYLGEKMSGGRIVVVGNVGDCMAQSISGGLLYVNGNCGNYLAGPLPGKQSGMRGGDVIVTGSCGIRVAERMRRGTVFIGGNAGDFGCARMIAGTVICLGTTGLSWCQRMKRGTVIVLRDLEDRSLHQFSCPRDFELSFLPLIWKHLSRTVDDLVTFLFAMELGDLLHKYRIPTTRWVKRRIGDLEHHGAGEILILQRIALEFPNNGSIE